MNKLTLKLCALLTALALIIPLAGCSGTDDARFFKRFQKRVLILAVSDKGKFFHINDCHIL